MARSHFDGQYEVAQALLLRRLASALTGNRRTNAPTDVDESNDASLDAFLRPSLEDGIATLALSGATLLREHRYSQSSTRRTRRACRGISEKMSLHGRPRDAARLAGLAHRVVSSLTDGDIDLAFEESVDDDEDAYADEPDVRAASAGVAEAHEYIHADVSQSMTGTTGAALLIDQFRKHNEARLTRPHAVIALLLDLAETPASAVSLQEKAREQEPEKALLSESDQDDDSSDVDDDSDEAGTEWNQDFAAAEAADLSDWSSDDEEDAPARSATTSQDGGDGDRPSDPSIPLRGDRRVSAVSSAPSVPDQGSGATPHTSADHIARPAVPDGIVPPLPFCATFPSSP